MSDTFQGSNLKIIARIENDFCEKFGIPHQSGRLMEQKARIIFEPEFRVAGLSGELKNMIILLFTVM